MGDDACQRERVERKIWDSELHRIDNTLRNYSNRAEKNAYTAGYGEAINFLMESYDILEHYSDSNFLTPLDDGD